MTQPIRIQRKRTAGWKAPLDENGLPPIYVGRPSYFGNPWRVGAPIMYARDAADAVCKHEKWILKNPCELERARTKLKGRNLMCWCKEGEPCHADILLRIANEDDL